MSQIADGIAIVGMAGRFPGANGVAEFWRNQAAGVESIRHFEASELESDSQYAGQPEYVRARSILEDVDYFDAPFFGMYPREAELTDPQQRLFLECCWETIEDAGYDPSRYPGSIGVFAGASVNTYFLSEICKTPGFLGEYTHGYQVSGYPFLLGSSRDFLATRIAYKLNLRGPAFTLQAGCSTSLIAVCQACQSLQTYGCDMALAGGVSVTFPQKRGYLYQDGGMASPDGHCRTFDENAQGTVFGSGCAAVLLKRAEDAIADGDHIYAVIRGYALNNDGAAKAGYTAPSVTGQAQVIAMAQAAAGVDPDSIGYIEAHGTGTPLGDPVEVAALTQVFRAKTQRRGYCAIGTCKTNVGHLDIASGVTGLIHAVEVLRNGRLPPTLHFTRPNPKLNLEESPFFVNTGLREWGNSHGPRRAGVSAFGVGGTNAHVVLEEAPANAAEPDERPQLLVVSARSEAALEAASARLGSHLSAHPEVSLADAAYTLQTGRRQFEFRRAVVARNREAAIEALGAGRAPSANRRRESPTVAFLFPGQGAQRVGMGAELYRSEAVFRRELDRCSAILKPLLSANLLDVLHAPGDDGAAAERLTETALAQPAIFALEYALARQWMSWGIRPAAMVGHSVGEFVAACLAGVFSLEDALGIVAERGRLMQALPRGAMLAIRLPEDRVLALLDSRLSLAAVNSPKLCVASGPFDAIEELEEKLARGKVVSKRLATSHAFHSAMVDPILEPLADRLRGVKLNHPSIPWISTVTGTWIQPEEAASAAYWAGHCRHTVRFSNAVQELLRNPDYVPLEVGPGSTLATLTRQLTQPKDDRPIAASLGDAANRTEPERMLDALGKLWLAGIEPDWTALHSPSHPRRCALPAYPFERKRYWYRPAEAGNEEKKDEATPPMPAPATESRLPRLEAELIQLFEELSGAALAGGDPNATFLELGFDSLFLTQAAQALAAKYRVKITFRQLLDQYSSVAALSGLLDEQLPADAPAPRPVALAPMPTAAPVSAPAAPNGSIESVLREQLAAFNQLMAQQLELLRGSAPAAPAPVSAAPTPTAPAAAPPAKEFKPFGPYKPVQKTQGEALTARQQQTIESLISRYSARTASSKRHTEAHRKHLADPRVVSGFRSQWKEMVYPIVTGKSEGSKLWDLDGNEYIDILNGFGPTVFGHRPDFVTKAVAKQLGEGFEIGPQAPLAGEVARTICEFTGMERATFCNTGSEAVVAAMRVARTVTGRKTVVFFAGDYHGMFDEVLVKGVNRNGVRRAVPIAPGIPQEKADNMIVLDYGTAESLEWIRAHVNELAAVLVEPVQSRHPNLQPLEFLKELRKITAEAKTALIFDEVVTGFRTHPGGCQAIFGIRADMATYGKVLGGGLPIGVLAGSAEYMDALDGGTWQFGDDSGPEKGVTFFAGTFVRHPLALAATAAVLEHLKEQGPALQERLNSRTSAMVSRINAFLRASGVPVEVQHFSSIFYFSFPADLHFGSLFYYFMREKGVHVLEGFPCFLTTAHSDADIDHIVRSFEDSVREMQAGELLPAAPESASDEATDAPLTEAQREIWLSDQLGPEASRSYNESFTVHLSGELNEAALHQALADVVERHDALRATFAPEGDRILIAPTLDLKYALEDLSASGDSAFRAILAEEASEPFDLIHGPLLRVRLVRLAAQKHAVVITAHHIVCDGWSTNVLLDELSRLYSAACTGTAAGLPPAMGFSEYARDERRAIESGAQDAERYWLAQFRDLPQPLELPVDRPRPAVKSFEGATYRTQIPAPMLQKVKQAGARQGCTLFVTLLAGFQALLHRLTNQDDIVVGIPAAGQSLVEGQALVGHCVHFLPLRARFSEGETAAALLAQVKQNLLAAYEHQNYTFGTLVRKLNIRRDPSRLPLIEVQFNLERIGGAAKFHGLEARVDPNPKAGVNFDIFFNIVESASGLMIDCDYNTALFDRETMAQWIEHFETLLGSMAETPQLPLAKLALLSPAQRKELEAWNGTAAEYPARCVHDLVDAQAERTPDGVAVACGPEEITYAELKRRSDALAGRLRGLGAGRGAVVAICVERSVAMVESLLGVMKSGAAYLPLDPAHPAERLKLILDDATPAIVISESHLAPALPQSSAKLLLLDRETFTAPPSAPAQAAAVSPDDLAYLIYTSGSTGKPKGVEIQHRALVNFLWSMRREPSLGPQDTLLAVTTLSFDIAGLEIYLPLVTGARLAIASSETATDGRLLLDELKARNVTVFQATPVTYRMLIEAGWNGDPKFKALCGGEALPRDLANAIASRAESLWNMYGPTETTIWSSALRLSSGEGPVPVGGPIANTQFHILDANGEIAPAGAPGELAIGGDGLARGYYRRPDLTAEKFITGARLYRTGDLVRRLPDGSLEFLGRMDNQVKLRGFRIELGEIEAALAAMPGVTESAVVLREDTPGDKRLVAYLVSSGEIRHGALREALAHKLPGHMIPSAFVKLDAMPRTPNGKLDRKAFPAPGEGSASAEAEWIAPRNEKEQTLASIVAEVLQATRVGVHDSFFDLGADSLHVFQIAARAARAGIPVTPAQIMRHHTVAGLSEAAANGAPKQRIERVRRERYTVPVGSI